MAWARWAYRPLRGSPWVLKYPYCHQMRNSIAFGKATSQRIYREQNTPKIR